MRSDAQEAALGLLGLTGHLDFSKTTTTSTTTTTAPGLSASSSHSSSNSIAIPGSKRKTLNSVSASATLPRPPSHSQPRSLAILLNNDDDPESPPQHPPSQPVQLEPRTTTTHNDDTTKPTVTVNGNGKPSNSNGVNNNTTATTTTTSDGIDCVCGFTYDDGFSVACDSCGTWVHAACFDIQHGNVPEIFKCWKCDKRRWDVEKLRERAVRLQRAQQAREKELDRIGVPADVDGGGGGKKRVSSPGVDRKRRVSATTMDQGGTGQATKRRRRLSTGASGQHSAVSHPNHHQQTPSFSQFAHPPGHGSVNGTSVGEEEHVEIDEPATHSYVHTDKDLVPHQHTRDRLKLLAQHWRGVTALESDEDLLDTPTAPVYLTPDELSSTSRSPKTSLHPLPKAVSHSSMHPAMSANMNVQSFIAPYASTIIPSTVYLSDPLNSYAHLGMPKPFVHLMGPPLDVALDARLAGNGSRFVRSGCKPNAVIRPVLCRRPHNKLPSTSVKQDEEDETLTFGVFALRDLKAQEEVVLGWEWDDGSVIHHLPALIDSPHLFAPARFEQYRHQMTSMLHTLSSTFTTCACGSRARDCALNRLAEFVDGHTGTPPTPSPSPPSSFSFSHGQPVEEREGQRRSRTHTSLGPLIGTKRGFRTRERVPMSGGMSGVEMDPCSSVEGLGAWAGLGVQPEAGPSKRASANMNGMDRTVSGSSATTDGSSASHKVDKKGKGRATDDDQDVAMENEDGCALPGSTNGRRVKGTAKKSKKAVSATAKPTSSAGSTARSSPQPDPQAHPDYGPAPSIPTRVGEAKLPPKLRKKWIHKNSEVLKESGSPGEVESVGESPRVDEGRASPSGSGSYHRDEMEVDDGASLYFTLSALIFILWIVDTKVMPPPPLPPSVSSPSRPPPIRDLPSRAGTLPFRPAVPADLASPTTSFANLSLLSPANGPAPHFPGCFGRLSLGHQGTSMSPTPGPGGAQGSNVDVMPMPTLDLSASLSSSTDSCAVLPEHGSPSDEKSMLGAALEKKDIPNHDDEGEPKVKESVQSIVAVEAVTVKAKSMTPPLEESPSPPPRSPSESTQTEEPAKALTPPPPPSTEKDEMETDMPEPSPTAVGDLAPEETPSVIDGDEAMVVDEPPRQQSPAPASVIVSDEPHATMSPSEPIPEVVVEKPADQEPEPEHETQPVVTSPAPETQPVVTPPPPAAPVKVKLSLKDFAMRMKKKREEAAASPIVASVGLAPEGVDVSVTGSQEQSQALGAQESQLQSSSTDAQVGVSEAVNGSAVGLRSSSPSAPPTKSSIGPSLLSPKLSSDTSVVKEAPAESLLETGKLVEGSVEEELQCPKGDRSSPEDVVMNSAEPARVPDKVDVDGHKVDADGRKDVGMTLEAKIEVVEPRLPSTHAEERAPSRFSAACAEDKLPPPRPRSPPCRVSPLEDRPHFRARSPPPPSEPPRRSDFHSSSSEYSRKENHEPFHLPDRPTMGPPRMVHQPIARQISQEDGEIFSPPPPKPLPLAPRSHTPPTQPRSFHHSGTGNTSPVRGPPSAAPRRPLQPSVYRPQLPPAANSRPLPSGPRALRGVGNNGPPSYSSSSSYNSSFPPRSDGPHLAPRGPSADRDRDRERLDWDRDRGRPSWSRSRGSGGGWAR
ncbi:hypothetical protein BDY19DRAFT_980344 [Irpex rosettiformis]|uniref:Uncharacterized protein n=1 Tax=Irpex rosettiformis TaxID=378272 RepID=A0ACB8TMH0_9APHY|nr:hypothetical protein BDY19DRAFT_980344 [Irpex rosettiformis]